MDLEPRDEMTQRRCPEMHWKERPGQGMSRAASDGKRSVTGASAPQLQEMPPEESWRPLEGHDSPCW